MTPARRSKLSSSKIAYQKDSEDMHYAKMPSPLMTCWPKHVVWRQARCKQPEWEKSLPHTLEEVNRVHHEKQMKPPRSQGAKPQQTHSNTCRQCGLVWPYKTSPCPAKGKTCWKCGKPNHFAKMCLTKSTPNRITSNSTANNQINVNQVSAAQDELASSSDDKYLYTINHSLNAPKIPKVSVKIGDVVVKMVIDTGATTDILDEATYRNIHQNEDTASADHKTFVCLGSDSQLTILGKFDATIAFKDKYKDTTIHVIQGNHGSLLSYKTVMELGILDLHVNHVSDTVPVHEQLCRQYSGIFKNDIGRLKGVEVKLHIDQSVPPVPQRAR